MIKLANNIYKIYESLSPNDTVDRRNFNIEKEYAYLNRLLFNNELPKNLKLSWIKSKVKFGLAKAKMENGQAVPTEINLSDFFEVTYEQMMGILVHEMVHTYLQQNQLFNDKYPHDHVFSKKVDDINRSGKVNFKVPPTESIEFIPKGKQSKTVLALCQYKNNKPYGIVVLSIRLADEMKTILGAFPEGWFQAGNKVEAWETNHPDLSNYPEARKAMGMSKWKTYGLLYPTLFDEIEKNGKLLWVVDDFVAPLPSIGFKNPDSVFG